MQTRRTWMLAAVSGVVALAVVAGSTLAAELFGTVKEVDAAGNKLVVTEKGTDKDVTVTVNNSTVIETAKGKTVPLEKIKAKAKVQVTHEGGVASKIVLKGGLGKKKAP